MKVAICIRNACHLRGLRGIIEEIQELVSKDGLGDKMDSSSSFCGGDYIDGAYVMADGQLSSSKPGDTKEFFAEEVQGRL